MDEERKFLEGLLKERFTFFIVFAPVYIFGVYAASQITYAQRIWALFIGVIIFALFTFAIWRTNKLVNQTLDNLRKYDSHPYSIICKSAGPRPRANSILLAVCFFVVILSIGMLITTCTKGPATDDNTRVQNHAIDK